MTAGRRPLRRSRTVGPAAVLAIATVIGSGPGGSARADDWTSAGLGGGRGRAASERSGPAFAAGAWQNRLPAGPESYSDDIVASVSAADGYVAFASMGGPFRVLQEATGATVWEQRSDQGFISSPAIWRGLVFLADLQSQLTAVSLATGQRVWTRDLQAGVWASPLVVDGALYIGTSSPRPRLLRLDPATGHVLWEVGDGFLGASLGSSPAVSGRHLVIGATGGWYHALDTADGRRRWTARTEGDVNLSSPLILGDRVYLLPGGSDHRLHALELASGLRADGWPLTLPLPAEAGPLAETRLQRLHVVSSLAGAGQRVVLLWRIDDSLDANRDGGPDRYLSREYLVAIDVVSRQVAWIVPHATMDTTRPSLVPTHGLAPSPLLHGSASGKTHAVAASSLSPVLRVVDLATGGQLWSTELSAATRSSPVLANGRLLVATDAGVVHGLLSSTNRPPLPPTAGLSPAGGQPVAGSFVSVRWDAGHDPEGEPLRYEVRLDDDGEILRDWDFSVTTAPGERAWMVASALRPTAAYSYGVRARDPQGAWSPWSALQTFKVDSGPPVLVEGQPVGSLSEAVGKATAGTTITLAPGIYRLGETLRVPAGASLVGAGPHLTVLDGRALPVGVSLASGARLGKLTVKSARVGVSVDGAREVELRNVIVRDSEDAGVHVGPGSSATILNGTLAHNGTALRVSGATELRNTLVTRNDVGIAASDPSLLTSRYNNVAGNRLRDRDNAGGGEGDLSQAVAFEDPTGGASSELTLRLMPGQPTTDRGDPADDFSEEPMPNGGRINIGAFGNTAQAELSAAAAEPVAVGGGDGSAGAPGFTAPPTSGKRALCSLAARPGGTPDGSFWLLLLILLRLRPRRGPRV